MLTRRLGHEPAGRDEVEEHLSRAFLDHHAQVELLGDVYRRVQSTLLAIRLDPYVPPSGSIDLELAHLVPFFHLLAKEFTRICAAMKGALEKEGVQVAIAVAASTLSGLYHRDPYFPVEATLEDLAPREREWAMRTMAHYISAVVRLEKENDFGNA